MPLLKTPGTTYDAIIYTKDPDAVRAAGMHVNSVFPEFVTAQVTMVELERAPGLGAVTYIDPGSTNVLHNDVSIPDIGASLLHGGLVNNTPYKGQGALVVVYDSGIDWNHLDFRNPSDPTKSRILAIWDQTLTPVGSETSPAGLGYGVEYTKSQIDDELDGTPTGFLRTMDVNGHGSHVAGTAAGNGGALNGKNAGVAPLADIIVVKGGDNSYSEVRIAVSSPTPISFTRAAGETGDGPDVTDGTITLWNYLSSLNGQRNVYANVHDKSARTPKSGTWTISVTNNTTSSITYDGWLADRTVGASTVTVAGGNVEKTVSMPGTSAGAITVGAYATKWIWPVYTGQWITYGGTNGTDNISAFSTRGPTRDGRLKPDIAAPGEGTSSVLSSAVDTTGQFNLIHPGQKHWLLQGASMSAPHVTGACALLLGAKSTLKASQIKTLIGSTASSDAFATGLPNNLWGYGKLDIVEALAKSLNPAATVVQKTFAYDVTSASIARILAGLTKYAVRVTPDVNGRLSGIKVNVTSNSNGIVGTGNMLCEVYTNNGGQPGTKLGNTVQHGLGLLYISMYNYVQMLDASVDVTSGTDYFIVLSVPGAGDTVRIRTDDGSVAANRSHIFNGTTWSALTPNNFRIQTIVTTTTGVSSVDPVQGLAVEYELLQNYPNPFNPSTTIGFSIPAKSKVSLRIFNLLGQEVALLANDDLAAGKYQIRWNPEGLASGTYFYRLQAGSYVESKKLLYLK